MQAQMNLNNTVVNNRNSASSIYKVDETKLFHKLCSENLNFECIDSNCIKVQINAGKHKGDYLRYYLDNGVIESSMYKQKGIEDLIKICKGKGELTVVDFSTNKSVHNRKYDTHLSFDAIERKAKLIQWCYNNGFMYKSKGRNVEVIRPASAMAYATYDKKFLYDPQFDIASDYFGNKILPKGVDGLINVLKGEGYGYQINENNVVGKDFRISPEYIETLRYTRARDNMTCQVCGKRLTHLNDILEVHHIRPYTAFPELRLDLNNLISVCPECHKVLDKRPVIEFYAKASTDSLQINDRLHKLNNLEIQLKKEDLYKTDFIHKDFIKVLHIPMGVCNIEDLDVDPILTFLESYQPQGEILVFHVQEIKNLPEIKANIEKLLKYDVQIAIENTAPINPKQEKLFNGWMFQNVQLAKYLQEFFGDRIGTVLDICHAQISETFLESIQKTGVFTDIDLSLKNYFEQNKQFIKLIHLATKKGSGFGENHATPFESKEDLQKVLALYEENEYSCPITIEVNELDHSKSLRLQEVISQLEDLYYIERK